MASSSAETTAAPPLQPIGVCYAVGDLKKKGLINNQLELVTDTHSSDFEVIRKEITEQIRKELISELHQLLPARSGIPKPVHGSSENPSPVTMAMNTQSPNAVVSPLESWDSMKLGVPLTSLLGKPRILMCATSQRTASPSFT
jgi:hypothetical protein